MGTFNLKSNFQCLFIVMALGVISGCFDEEPIITSPPIDTFEQDFPIVFKAELPAGKLPYPHHNPEFDQGSYDSLIQNLFIINNFGLYQCGDEESTCYFHDGLDFIFPNGTPIFALEDGTVRGNIGGNQYYRTLVVEDKDEPGFGWTYTHIFNFQVATGDEVNQGQYLGSVNFKGLEHIHLNRTKLREAGSWKNFSDLINIYPDEYFTFIDNQAPIIKTPFHFFKNNSNLAFTNEEGIDTISGDVDIVVSMRDAGEYASDFIENNGLWGDRLAVRDISYRIIKDGVEILNQKSFDFTKLEFRFHSEKWKETLTVFKPLFILDGEGGSNNMFHSHYIITNASENHQGEINPQDGNLSWVTSEIDSLDLRIYPNGLYTIEVTAYDSNGNETTKTDEVFVQN